MKYEVTAKITIHEEEGTILPGETGTVSEERADYLESIGAAVKGDAVEEVEQEDELTEEEKAELAKLEESKKGKGKAAATAE